MSLDSGPLVFHDVPGAQKKKLCSSHLLQATLDSLSKIHEANVAPTQQDVLQRDVSVANA